ncbi:hypothetical protein EMG21_28475 [Klebsiella pneumoniae]|nr:hypothetical protein EMG21_28475 [Klebsiella pneumoniae]
MNPADRYSIATQMHHTARTELINAAANLGHDPSEAIELLELLRATLHRQIDEAIDAAQTCRPSATRPVLRTRRYTEPSL